MGGNLGPFKQTFLLGSSLLLLLRLEPLEPPEPLYLGTKFQSYYFICACVCSRVQFFRPHGR